MEKDGLYIGVVGCQVRGIGLAYGVEEWVFVGLKECLGLE